MKRQWTYGPTNGHGITISTHPSLVIQLFKSDLKTKNIKEYLPFCLSWLPASIQMYLGSMTIYGQVAILQFP